MGSWHKMVAPGGGNSRSKMRKAWVYLGIMRGRKWDVKVDAGENSEAPSVKRCLSHPGDEWGLDMRTPETQLLSVLLPDHAESPGNTTPSSSDSLSTCHETYSSQWGMARALVSRSLPRLSVRSQASLGCPLTPTHFTVP